MAGKVYLNNEGLKAKGVKIPYTPETFEEYVRCKDDPIYFIEKYCQIVTLDHGIQPFKLYDYQIKFIKTLHEKRRVIAMLPRQHGKCLLLNTKVKLKQKSTGKIVEVTLGEFYEWQRFAQHGSIEDMQRMQEDIQSKEWQNKEV